MDFGYKTIQKVSVIYHSKLIITINFFQLFYD